MALSISRAIQTIFVATVTTLIIVACGSSEDSTFNGGNEPDTGTGQPPPGSFIGQDGSTGAGGSCNKRTCADLGIECGPSGDGCGGIIPDCGKCAVGQRCGGPNAPSKCVNPTTATGCVPKTCADLSVTCGPAGDGCGGVIQCGACGAGQQCGGPGKPSQCVQIGVIGADGGACTPKTCADYPAGTCGQQSDGCNGSITCTVCVSPEFCGGAGPSKCGTTTGGACTKKTCADYSATTCGPQSDGCGGTTVSCGPGCTPPQTCGGGGTPSVCGGGGVVGPGGGPCVPKTCVQLGTNCGQNADGCGNIIDCGASCPAGQVCGGAGTPNVCAVPPCTPKAACDPGLNCGSQADGCGGSVVCGGGVACTAPAICGGGGTANVCGGGTIGGPGGCTPATCGSLGKNCGPVADGCGNLLACGTCTVAGDFCGGGGTASVCGQPACTPTTCQALGMNCGFAANGCGALLDCGGPNACPIGQYCGGGGVNRCGVGTPAPGCVNYCLDQAVCAAGQQTRVTGTVFAPNGTLPLPGAIIYVPNASKTYPHGLDTFVDGVATGTCQQCSTQASGNPLISATSNADGTFTLNNVPANTAFPLVIQMGRWRRVVSIPAVAPCTPQALTADQTRMPKSQNEGNDRTNIPLIAISTGEVDALECVFRKLGIDDNQFTNPTGTAAPMGGRIRFYQDELSGSANGGARINSSTPRTQNALVNNQANLDQYDAVIFGCPSAENTRSNGELDRVRAYANKGGRVFATHFSYVWLFDRTPWNTTVTWDSANARSGNWTGQVDTTPGTKRELFSQWLAVPAVNALSASTPPRIAITEARNNADIPAAAGSEVWITKYDDPVTGTPTTNGKAVLHYTFNTPTGAAAANQCGRVLFSDFHVSIGTVSDTTNFPNECNANALTSQEKVLAFMLFDLTSCIAPINPPPPPTCTPLTCAQQNLGCGLAGNGCGQTIDCGPCPVGQTCGGGGVPSQCGGACTPRTCAQANANCGTIPDGCGSTQNCGPCTVAGQTCGGGGVANQCGAPSCTPITCQQQGLSCGLTGDGCGNTIPCGTCPLGQTCGGGGTPGQCGAPSCTPIATCPAGKNCGQVPDGCGGVVECGQCVPGQVCGGGGAPNVCGVASCSPKTCAQLGAQCGGASDGCGSVADCGVCPAGRICQNNVCIVPTCNPTTCSAQGVQCGPLGDGCGGLLACGTCPPGQVCGGGGQAGVCGTNPCVGKTCADLGAVCGQVANGCGALTPDCGTCQGNTTCQNGACINACTPRTCQQANAQCGPIADGCGSTVDCGPCPPGQTCGANNKPNQCGSDGIK